MSKKIKIEVFKCKHLENEYDGFDKYAWCRNKDCPTRECWCNNIIEEQVCPYFNKEASNKPVILEYNEDYIKDTKKDFLEKLLNDCQNDLNNCVIELDKILNKKENIEATITKLRNIKND